MTTKTARPRLAVLWLFPLLVIAAGCATDPAAQAAKQKAEEEYVYITVTGSNIPKRIKKSDILKDNLPKDGDAQVVDKEQFLRSLGTGKKIERGS